jgi:hypothetical protein
MERMKLNQKIYINNYDGTYTPALFKGFIDNDCCLVKPKERFVRGGYGMTITALTKNILTEEQVSNVSK